MKDALVTALVAALPIVVAWLGATARRYLATRIYAQQVETIARRARAVVADQQRDVDALKNPDAPGAWDRTAAAAVRAEAVRRVRALEPLACQNVLAALDNDSAALDALIGTHVEEAVREIRRTDTRAPAQAAAS